MKPTPRYLLLSAALGAALSLSATASAQDAGLEGDVDAGIVAEAEVPAERLVERYAGFAGSEEAAAELVSDLRTGGEFTWTEEVTTTVTNDDGTTTTTTELVERTLANPNGPMGYGEVNITLSLAKALVDAGTYPDLQSALTGIATTTTHPDGTTTTVVEGGVLAMRADGMGWGRIAQEFGFNLGSLVSASNRNARADASVDAAARGQAAGAKASGRAKVDVDAGVRTGRPDTTGRPARIERPAMPTRPERPERPERSQRGGGG
ncbi:hypothetical protein GCM10028862_01340 [Luteimonas pelagia]